MSAHPERRPGCPELLPCPFGCGGSVEVNDIAPEDGFELRHGSDTSEPDCLLQIVAWFPSAHEAREAWNTRVPDPAAHAALEAERDTLFNLKVDIGKALGGDDERPFVERVLELRAAHAALERVERVLGNGEGLPDGCPDTYPERAGCALGILRAALAGKAVQR